ncbi:cell division protein FtsL [Streptomyces cinnamoneus]|uniref:Cell division protein FtsL n=1 Tax=Streptomyces cinnamoneus TaxID=53446 RepID=A0A2G1XQH9_STRCJ|nr:septum formation initiator family protein [Streptomyces cinnamoneus]PHQ53498.1 cell division protein FtsL [Streptomyces cinnamoneus]PPT12803.1 cell division protein FtsL [Streptomyces cinnamoneus]
MTPAARRGPRLGRLLPPGVAGARRTPFVLLVVVLLGSGLISLLLLNSSLNQGSFDLSRLQRKTTELTDEEQALQQEVDQLAAPDALERRARELGMVPGGSPAFLNPDGTVSGVPGPASSEVPAAPAAYAAPEAPAPAPAVPAAPSSPASPLVPLVAPAPSAAPAVPVSPLAVPSPAPPPADGRKPTTVPAVPALPPPPADGNLRQVR